MSQEQELRHESGLQPEPVFDSLLDSPAGNAASEELAVRTAIALGIPRDEAERMIRPTKPTYPYDHKAAMRVPKGGSSCASCEYLVGHDNCRNEHFIKWHGSSQLPYPADEFCSDWYEQSKNLTADG